MLFTVLYSLLLSVTAIDFKPQKKAKDRIFREDQIIYQSNDRIINLLAPADCSSYTQLEITEIPTIFFTAISNRRANSTIYVLERYIPYEVLVGGKDATSDYGKDNTVYFGASNGLYKYDRETLSAKRFGTITDDIIQLQKANHSDAIYILTSQYKIYKVTQNGTIKKRITSIFCATQFVLDTSDNIYYIECRKNLLFVLVGDIKKTRVDLPNAIFMKERQLIRPAFVMQKSVPFLGDSHLYVIYSNGSTTRKEFIMHEKPSAISIDASLYFVTALDGNIYELNVMELMLESMFKIARERPTDVYKMIMDELDNFKGWYVKK